MKQIIFLFATLVLILSSCNNNKTVIEGYVLQAGSDSPIENAEVEIEYGFSTDIISGAISVEDRVYTDASGYFYWETEEDFNGWYQIGDIGAENYFGLDWSFSGQYDALDQGEKYSGTLHLDPFAYLRLHVEDVEAVESDYCRIGGTIVLGAFELFGESYNEIYLTSAFRENTISYRLFYEDTMKIVPLIINPFDTLDYTIKY